MSDKPEPKVVLIVDDEPLLREILSSLFQQQGWRSFEAASGHAAYEFLKRERVDVVLSDVRMPDGDGVELLERIVSELPSPKPLVFLLTGYTDMTEQEAIALGAVRLLYKPFNARDLIKVIIGRFNQGIAGSVK